MSEKNQPLFKSKDWHFNHLYKITENSSWLQQSTNKWGVAQDFCTTLWKLLRVTECLSSARKSVWCSFFWFASQGFQSHEWGLTENRRGPPSPDDTITDPSGHQAGRGAGKKGCRETKAFHKHPSSTWGWQITECLLKLQTVQGSHILSKHHILLWDVLSGSNNRG